MQAVILIGIPGAGKTTFYRQRFFDTHVRISLDMLRTRHRERILLNACLAAQQPFVIDNTNVRRADRARYIPTAKAHGFRTIGYYFPANLDACLRRNAQRADKPAIPAPGVLSKHKHLEPPDPAEGFDELYSVTIAPDRQFTVDNWPAGSPLREQRDSR